MGITVVAATCAMWFHRNSCLLCSLCLLISCLKISSFTATRLLQFGKYSVRTRQFDSVDGRFYPTSPNANSKSFIISPTSPYEEERAMILDNFSQIQMGERKKIGIIGTQLLSESHQQMIELLSYALVLSGNHVYTSGGGNGTNIAVIRGALRACNPDLLTVMLPQSLAMQPSDMQVLLSRVGNLIEMPVNDDMELREAANLCNARILNSVDKALGFAYHDSHVVLASLDEIAPKIEVTRFFLD